VKTQQVVIRNNVVNWRTCFGLLGGHHQVQQVLAIGDQYIPRNISTLLQIIN